MQQENKNDSVQLSSRYQQYMFAKGHLRERSGREVFPINGSTKQDKGIVRRQFDMSGKGYCSQQDRLYSEKGVMACLPNANPDNKILLDQPKIRRLTPRECERLQGLPDDWTKYGSNGYMGLIQETISDSQRYKMCGNAVTTNVIKEIMKNLIKS